MARIPISAFYYSTSEKALILGRIQALEETDSFIYGLATPDDIANLKKANILVDMHRDIGLPPSGMARGLGGRQQGKRNVHFFDGRSGAAIPEPESPYYLISLQGPLLDKHRELFHNNGISILESIAHNVYKVRVRDPGQLESLDQIKAFRAYTVRDKEISVERSKRSIADPFALEIDVRGIYDIRLIEEVSIRDFLNSLGLTVLAESPKKVRVEIQNEEQLTRLSGHPEVDGIEKYILPELHNDLARELLGIDLPNGDSYQISRELTGQGEIVAVADTGIDQTHPDFKGRILKASSWGRKDDTTDPNGHGTHVAGSILGDGTASGGRIKGMAPESKLFFQSLLDPKGGIGGIPHDLHQLFQEAYDAGARIHNNSWGSATESEYRFNSLEVDEFVYKRKDMLIVISAGNEGSASEPRHSQPGFVDWLSLGSPATSKNGLCVGASRSSRKKGGLSRLTHGMAWPDKYPGPPINELTVSGDPEGIAGFSSRGPCGNESRIKPDVVAPGTDIASTRSALAPMENFWGPFPKNRLYAFMGGTSMSAPIVAGLAALLREYLRVERQYAEPSAALLKAMLVNSTQKLKGEDALADHQFIPNFHQGYGRVNLRNLLRTGTGGDFHLHFFDTWKDNNLQFDRSGQRFLWEFQVDEGRPLRICLCWTDPPGRGIQNNLNSMLMHMKDQHKWVGNEEVPRMITTFDRDNNVEVIRIEDPHGGTYRLAVQATNLLNPPQDFAVVITGNIPNEPNQLT